MNPLRPDPESQAVSAYKPASHRDDPDTSREAARKLRDSGLLGGHMGLALWILEQHAEGITVPEMATYLMLHREVAARFSVTTQGEKEYYRQLCGRRMADIREAGRGYPEGERNGFQIWWPGKKPASPGAPQQAALFEAPAKWRTD